MTPVCDTCFKTTPSKLCIKSVCYKAGVVQW